MKRVIFFYTKTLPKNFTITLKRTKTQFSIKRYNKRMKTKYPALEEFVNGVFEGSENVERDLSVAIVAIHAACHNKELQKEALEFIGIV